MKYMKLGSKPDVFQTEGNNIRFVATELATDIVINVGDVKFYLHKFPLLSKSCRLQKIMATTNEESNDEIDISDIPGGPNAFEICAKFCYGMIVTLNAYNVVAARCAAEYLEMYESIEKGNLIYKIEVFLNSSIFRTWKDSIIVLQTTRSLLLWSEDLKVISHCIDSIASKACIDPSEVEWSYTYNRKKLPSENGLDQHWNGVQKQHTVPKDWWVEDLCELEMEFYKRVIMAIKTKGGISGEIMGEALEAYAHRRLLGFVEGTIAPARMDIGRHRTVLETIVWLLLTEKGSVPCGFLLALLRAACLLDSSETCRKELIKRIGGQLPEASVADLLIPAVAGESTRYNIGIVMKIVEEFLIQHKSGGEIVDVGNPDIDSSSSKIAVSKLIDGFLAEIAKDPNLPLCMFVELAEMISDAFRPVHDELYRAIDTYLREHSGLSKSEKKKLCGLMDCKNLSTDACMHAVQNERLPLRVVVQVLFFEQARASAATGRSSAELPVSVRSLVPRENGNSHGSSRSAATATASTTTTTEDDWGGGAPSSGNINSFRSIRPANQSGGRERSSGNDEININKNGDDKSGSKVKPIRMPANILSKLWSGKGHGENGSTDALESPGSNNNQEETKSTPRRNTRHSVS